MSERSRTFNQYHILLCDTMQSPLPQPWRTSYIPLGLPQAAPEAQDYPQLLVADIGKIFSAQKPVITAISSNTLFLCVPALKLYVAN